MANIFRVLFSISLISVLVSCSEQPTVRLDTWNPPESKCVLENGSRPEGFYQTLKKGGIDVNAIQCNSQNRYGEELKPYSEKSVVELLDKLTPYLKPVNDESLLNDILEDHLMWSMVRAILLEGNNNNLGAILLDGYNYIDKFGKERPVIIFRMAFTPDPEGDNSPYRSVIENGNVAHVINLYDGEMNMNNLVKQEESVAKQYGATYIRTSELGYGTWRDTIRKYSEQSPERDKASEALASLIVDQILMPEGKRPSGNILIHCGGGMHRTGMVVGLLQKIINKDSKERIESNYRYHTGYRNQQFKGGFEQDNLDFIFNFDESRILNKLGK